MAAITSRSTMRVTWPASGRSENSVARVSVMSCHMAFRGSKGLRCGVAPEHASLLVGTDRQAERQCAVDLGDRGQAQRLAERHRAPEADIERVAPAGVGR